MSLLPLMLNIPERVVSLPSTFPLTSDAGSAPKTSFPSVFKHHSHPQILGPGVSVLGEEFLIALPIIFAFYVIDFYYWWKGAAIVTSFREFISGIYVLNFAFSL